jgi:protein-S-isoprenylcysteine O-methyltransferase Ste14
MLRALVLVKLGIVLGIVAAILFGSAGRLDLPYFWAYFGVLAAFGLLSMLTLGRDLVEERYVQRAASRDNLALLRGVVVLAFVAEWVIAGLDVGRFGWSAPFPRLLQPAALATFGAALLGWYWAMRVNPFFSPAVRIQRERGHRVVRSGPYGVVRHPGYASFAILGAAGPLVLGSWWAALPHLAVVVLFVRRAAFEDRMLRAELAGYADYATQVRFRLVPGVW